MPRAIAAAAGLAEEEVSALIGSFMHAWLADQVLARVVV